MSAQATNTNGIGHYVEPRPTTSLARVDSVEPTTMAELRTFAKDAADSNFFGAKTPQQAMMIAMAGRDLGFSYTQALRAFHVINGRPSLSADGMVAACMQHPEICEYFRCVESTPTKATWETKRVGDEPRRFSFTIAEAETAQLTGKSDSNWKKYPQRMLSARAKSFLARDVYPEILMGLYDPDEIVEASQSRGTIAASVVSEVVESRTVEPDNIAFAKQRGAECETPAQRMAYWKSIADETKHWPKSDRAAVLDYFKSLDDAYARAAAAPPIREPGEEG